MSQSADYSCSNLLRCLEIDLILMQNMTRGLCRRFSSVLNRLTIRPSFQSLNLYSWHAQEMEEVVKASMVAIFKVRYFLLKF